MHLGKNQGASERLETGLVCRIYVDGRCLMQFRGISLLLLVEAVNQVFIRKGWDISA